MSSGSGSDPHLLALLRAIRLRQAAPDAAAAGAADAAAALSHPNPLSVTSEAADSPPELSAEPAAPPVTPANPDPFARAADTEQQTSATPALPAVRPTGRAPIVPPLGLDAGLSPDANPALPTAPDQVVDDLGRPDDAATTPDPGDQVRSGAARSAEVTRPAGTPPLGNLVRVPAASPYPGLPAGALGRPAWQVQGGPIQGGPVQGGPVQGGPVQGGPVQGGAVQGGPIQGGQIQAAAARMPVNPVSGPVPLGRPVPGWQPEAPSPARLAAAMRALAPPPPSAAGAGTIRPGPPVDGMNPADDAALREMQRLLGNSLSLAGGPGEVAGRLRAALAQAQPDLLAALPGGPQIQHEQLAEALTWLVQNLDQPPALVAGCGSLGAALAECGVQPKQLQLVGAALAEAMRAGMAAGGWRQDFDQAWRTTWQHTYEWIVHGEVQAQYQPTTWTAPVVAHERRRDDLAIVRLRPYLPMPFRPGQFARIEVGERPGVWRPYSLAGAPRRDGVVELHVRAKTRSGVSGALVYRTNVGDKIRLGRAEGAMSLPESPDRDLLLIAGDTGVAPLKALLTELAATGDRRSAVLFWGVRNLDELYDIDEVAQIARACRRVTVVPVISEGEAGPYPSGLVTDAVAAYGEWSDHEVYLAGPPIMLAATSAALLQLGVHPDRIHHDVPE